MRKYSFLAVILTIYFLSGNIEAQYWFQSGAQGSTDSYYNYGAKALIQTISPQPVSLGSLGYWIGETLSNGAFIQVGYEIPNSTNYYSTDCSPTGCNSSVYLNAGAPTWFWEYFPASYKGTNFYGAIGPDNSLGANGTFNTYSFQSSGNTWYTYINNKQVGSVSLGTSTSGSNPPLAIAEVADAPNNTQKMSLVTFKNIQYYDSHQYKLVPDGYEYIGYGTGSQKNVPNTYGVITLNNQVGAFETGTGLPTQNNALLWRIGYRVNIISAYGNITGAGNYTAYSNVAIYAPQAVNLTPSTRELFVGWKGSGTGSYTGSSALASVNLYGNVTETALWQTQYYVNVTTPYASTSGSGWYNANTTANLSISTNNTQISTGERALFKNWSTGTNNTNTAVYVNSPKSIGANWKIQYQVNATTNYGKITGNGWYDQNSIVTVSLDTKYSNINSTSRLAFTSWSNNVNRSTFTAVARAPILINAIFEPQYLVRLRGETQSGMPINVSYFNVDGVNVNSSIFLFKNHTHGVTDAYYKGVDLIANTNITRITPGETVEVRLPVYDVIIQTQSLLNTPLNTTVNITFKNHTRIISNTGPGGTITIYNVPYGYVLGNAQYLGETESISLYAGGTVSKTFLTPVVFESVLLGLIFTYLAEKYYFRMMRKRLKGPKRKQ